MKVAVYTITKNEEQFIKRWAESANEADYLLIVDTGSTDSTVELADHYADDVYSITVSPWRFDDARNAALSLIPSDIDMCISLDADEVLVPGWRQELEKLPPHVTRPAYKYTWSWNVYGAPDLQYTGDKIHSRHGYRWRHPVHEVLTPTGIVEVREWCGLEIHHYPDATKSRSSYLPLLELAVQEDPTDDRNSHYLAREYYYRGEYEKAAEEFKRHLSLPKAQWPAERAKSMRLLAQCDPDSQEYWLLESARTDPSSRESWVALAQYYHDHQEWEKCLSAAETAMSIQERGLTYITESWAWGPIAYDLGAVAAYHLGEWVKAYNWGVSAYMHSPDDTRLSTNVREFYLPAMSMVESSTWPPVTT